jgi:hypothetical protein
MRWLVVQAGLHALPRRRLPAAAAAAHVPSARSGALPLPPPLPSSQLALAVRAFRPAASDTPAGGAPGGAAAVGGAPPRAGDGNAAAAAAAATAAPQAAVPGAELRILKELGVYIWPKDRPELRARVGLALGLLLASKARASARGCLRFRTRP